MKPLALCLLSLLAMGPAIAETALPAPVTDADYIATDPDQVALGRLLFWDPVLSGNRNISCGTCHHPRFGTSDGVSLSLGEGGIGLGPKRRADPKNSPEQRIPRNSPALFNLGAREFTVLFHDGRIEVDPDKPGGLRTPLGEDMARGFANLLSAQTMFPVLSQDEMAGHYGENEISSAVRQGRITGEGGAWDLIARRVAALPDYPPLFEAAFPDVTAGAPITFVHISDAIAAFVAWEWRSDDSAFDRFLRGKADLTEAQSAGMRLFYGEAGCAECHSGPFQTDHGFHSMGAPQIGPGKAARFETHARDDGRFRVTGQESDRYAFRTPSLRNVLHTAPYGHAGAQSDLRRFLDHHIAPRASRYGIDEARLPPLAGAEDLRAWSDPKEREAILAAAKGAPALSDQELDAILAFLGSLSDPTALQGRLGIPDAVPSGLPVDH